MDKEKHFVRLTAFSGDVERREAAQKSINKCQEHLAQKRNQRALERAEYKKLIAFFHENRRNIVVDVIENKCYAIFKVSENSYRLAMCKKHPNDQSDWKFMKSLLAKRLQDPLQFVLVNDKNNNLALVNYIKDSWERNNY